MKKLISFALTLILCLSIVSCGGTVSNVEETESQALSKEEEIVAEFCISCMDFLKNPYSFKLKKAWINEAFLGSYDISITYTAENSVGGTVTNSFSTSIPLKESSISKIDSITYDLYLSEFASDTSSKGQYLDVDRIQQYIDENY